MKCNAETWNKVIYATILAITKEFKETGKHSTMCVSRNQLYVNGELVAERNEYIKPSVSIIDTDSEDILCCSCQQEFYQSGNLLE